jgi:hypothetical protein
VLKARLCARDLAKTKRTDLFAPGSTALINRVIDFKAVKLGLDTYTVEVVAAYNTIDESEQVIVTPPSEWYDERAAAGFSLDVLWRMKKLLPGRRIAAKLWVEQVGEVHRARGFEQCVGFRQFYYHKEKQLTFEVHMDDIHGCGEAGAIDAHLEEWKGLLVLKRAIRHGEGAVYQHLKRYRHICSEGRLIRPNLTYVKEVVSRLGLDEAKPATTPLSEILRPVAEDLEEPLDEDCITEYRRLTCTLLYASQGIAEVQYALGFLTMDLKAPTVKSWERLKRVTKYLKAVIHEGVRFPARNAPSKLIVSTDSDWAGCKRTRKSTSCIVIQCGGCTLYTQSVGQSIHSQSSGEAEFYSAVSGVSAGLGLNYLLHLVGMAPKLELQLDSSAARGVL